jgi:hypothetical protein
MEMGIKTIDEMNDSSIEARATHKVEGDSEHHGSNERDEESEEEDNDGSDYDDTQSRE